MALRKYMHSRNRYRKPPDYKELAKMYPEFCKVAIVDLAGNVHINFQSEESLRVLTEVLLKHDFDLDVKIPPRKLVPTLPLRLNYVLWIEDLIRYDSVKDIESVIGIDIGTGAVCIYPLLLVKMFNCHMIGTEIDETSIQTAKSNVQNNNLQNFIKVIKVNSETILKNAIEENKTYDFVMCNPPFFENKRDLIKAKRLPPRNAPTGNETELTVDGGEKTFSVRMIDESINMQNKIRIYTTMLGQKKTLKSVLELMRKKQIENVTWTEFCQGHTTRWGLAWTFLSKESLDLTKAPVIRKHADTAAKLLRTESVEISFPAQDKFSSADQFIDLFKGWMHDLHVNFKELNIKDEEFNGWACKLEAQTDSWTHARRKRRLAKRLSTIQSEKEETDESAKGSSSSITADPNDNCKPDCEINEIDRKQIVNVSTDNTMCNGPLLVCNLFVKMHADESMSEGNYFVIDIVYERGHGGKNALETFRQYLINQLNLREYYRQNRDNKSNGKRSKRIKES